MELRDNSSRESDVSPGRRRQETTGDFHRNFLGFEETTYRQELRSLTQLQASSPLL
jgi:hypothetical protein